MMVPLFRKRSRLPLLPIAMLLLILAGCDRFFESNTPSKPAPSSDSSRHVTPDGGSSDLVDRRLADILGSISQNQLENALSLTDELIKDYPTFRLGHLIRGDLLLARSRPITGMGTNSMAPVEQVNDLRDEAMARLRSLTQKPGDKNLPRYLVQMPDDQKFALIMDAKKSRLYLYANEKGKPRFVADYYVTQGKLGSEKSKEGDKRTPIGVYHVTANLPKQKLTDFYGSGAFPINYPNEWDKRKGRTGHGIWLHGTPSDTYSRPPKASDGCVVLANDDLMELAKNFQIGVTPVIISPEVEWLSQDDWKRERQELNAAIEAWRKDWESLDVERYLSHYSRQFSTADQDYERFAAQKRQVAGSKTSIKVQLHNLSVFRSPPDSNGEELIVVTFDQDYRSNNLNNAMKKRQYWLKEGSSWKIVHEGAA